MTKVDLNYVINYLNELVKIDRNAMEKLIDSRVLCNIELSEHPAVQVAEFEENGEVKLTVGLLGILNGLIGVHEETGWGYLAAEYDDNGILQKFCQTPKTIEKK